jgi:hypothetical protein
MIGTVICRASTTETTGGGGTRSAAARGEQPAIVVHAQAIPKASHPAAFGACCSSAAEIVHHRKCTTSGRIVRPTDAPRHARDTPDNGRGPLRRRDGMRFWVIFEVIMETTSALPANPSG